jgi:RHS repeat-associated protein
MLIRYKNGTFYDQSVENNTYTYDTLRSALPNHVSLPNTAYITNYFDPNARTLGTLLKNNANTTLDAATYSYNTAGQRTQMGRTDSSTVAYTYDPISQIKTALGSGGQSTENLGFTYDVAWNLNYLTNNGSTTTFTANSKNELTTVGSTRALYDSNGNITQFGDPTSTGGIDYSYDDENRLTEVDTNYNVSSGPLIGSTMAWQTDFTYDGLGRLRKRVEYIYGVVQSTTTYIYDGFRVIQERDGNNNPTVSYTRGSDLGGSFESAGGIGGLLSRSVWSGHAWVAHAYYHADGNGNVTYLADSSQGLAASYVYATFGNTTFTNGPLADANVYRFSSKECHINSGMYYFGFRFYAPSLQRWINRDPIEEIGGINLYECLGNSPLNRVDPLGLAWYDGIAALVGLGGPGTFSSAWGGLGSSLSDSSSSMGQALGGALTGNWNQVADAYDTGIFGQTQNADAFTYYGTRAAVATAAAATAAAIAVNAAGISTRIACHGSHHEFGPLGRLPHVQLNWWRAGVKGSGGALRIPVPPGTPGFPP